MTSTPPSLAAKRPRTGVPAGQRILGLETGGDHLSVALLVWPDGQPASGMVLLDEVVAHRGGRHTDMVLAMIDEVLARHEVRPADLALVGVGRGPGSFTGIRVGLSTALALEVATGVSAWPVCSLAAMACHVPRGVALPLIDARKGEVYGGLFRCNPGIAPEVMLAPGARTCEATLAAAHAAAEDVLVFGSGAQVHGVASPVPPAFHAGAARHVAWLAALAWDEAGRDARAAPALDAAYLRRSEAEVARDITFAGSA
ncbi:MAG: tRNA (adenosine(37)-N6)-threonylcarbamoyltransferase complex dimerization subunit type 1 TsaB [Myxococcota bacterium]